LRFRCFIVAPIRARDQLNMTLKDARVVIIGGTSGIGFAVAEAARDQGATVTVASSRAAHVEHAVERLGGGAAGFTVDVTDETSVAAAFAALGAFDHLVFTAGDWGGPRRSTFDQIDLDAAQGLFAVRFWGAMRVVKHAHGLLSPNGSITLTNGMIAHRPAKGAVMSAAMAGAVEHAALALSVELAPIRVNMVCPGYVKTEVWAGMPEDEREAFLARMTARQPLPRAAEASEVAEAYLYLMRGGYTTGQVMRLDGGWSMV
jgi:NAD(P)-dependent dehydrogenase (short-subunit alcohol dehydrogenase family)